jgi:4-amino-4-deoxy-L-arabinose transferase-like glycosyltransferase
MDNWPLVNHSPQLDSPVAPLPPSALTLSHARIMKIGVVGLLLVGAALRLVILDRVPPGLSHDEAYNGVTALEVWLLGRRDIFFDIYNGIEPLIVYWQALYLRLFGITPVAMRLVNVTAGLLTIPLTYALTRRLLASTGIWSARWGAWLAALGVSLSFWAIFVSRLALRAVTLPLMELPALYCFWWGLTASRRIDSGSGLSPGRRWAYFVLGGVWLGAAMYTYLSSRFLPFVPLLFFGYWLLRGQVRREHWLGMAFFLALWGLVFAPLGLYYLNHPDIFGRRAGQVLNLPLALAGDPRPLITDTLRTLGMFSVVGADTSRYGLAGRPVFYPLGAIFFHTGLIVSLVRLRRPAQQAAPYAFLLIWWLVMLVPDFITGESPHFLRTIGSLPPTYIFWALGILSVGTWLVPRIPSTARRLVLPALALYLAASSWLTVHDYFGRWAADAEARAIYGADFTEVARYLETADLDEPIALSAAYYRDWDRFRLDLQMHHHPPFVVWFNGPQTFLLPPPGTGLDPVYIFPRSAPPHPRWLDFLQIETQGTDITTYRLKPGVQFTLDAPLDAIVSSDFPNAGIAQLLGYQLEGKAQAGETLRLLLHWQPLRDVPGDPDYAFFVHLRDRHGYTWAQADANGYAVVDWQPGVQVFQWLELPLPPDLPPLEYTLVAGLEDRGLGQPLPMLVKYPGGAKYPEGDAVDQPPVTAVTLRTITPSVAAAPSLPDEFPLPNPSDVTVGELFTLHGYSIDPRFLKPGGSAHIALFWRAQAVPGTDYTLALWLVNPSGQQVMLGDREPLDGDYPTSRWGAGQWVRDRLDLTLPPDLPGGLYQVFVGWHNPSGAWLMAGDAPGIGLGEIFVSE